MVFLILSYQYPEDSHRQRYLREAGPHATQVSPFHKPLAVSASDEQWKTVLSAIRHHTVDPSYLDSTETPRSLRPNDDNYQAFVGLQWKPRSNVDTSSIPPAMAVLLQRDDDPTTVYPRYDRCAACTQPATLQCSKCKIVKYCRRDPCQSMHWKKCHRRSCLPATADLSLWRCLHGSDGFLVSPEECRALHASLSNALSEEPCQDKLVIQCFRAYFEVASELGGCFLL